MSKDAIRKREFRAAEKLLPPEVQAQYAAARAELNEQNRQSRTISAAARATLELEAERAYQTRQAAELIKRNDLNKRRRDRYQELKHQAPSKLRKNQYSWVVDYGGYKKLWVHFKDYKNRDSPFDWRTSQGIRNDDIDSQRFDKKPSRQMIVDDVMALIAPGEYHARAIEHATGIYTISGGRGSLQLDVMPLPKPRRVDLTHAASTQRFRDVPLFASEFHDGSLAIPASAPLQYADGQCVPAALVQFVSSIPKVIGKLDLHEASYKMAMLTAQAHNVTVTHWSDKQVLDVLGLYGVTLETLLGYLKSLPALRHVRVLVLDGLGRRMLDMPASEKPTHNTLMLKATASHCFVIDDEETRKSILQVGQQRFKPVDLDDYIPGLDGAPVIAPDAANLRDLFLTPDSPVLFYHGDGRDIIGHYLAAMKCFPSPGAIQMTERSVRYWQCSVTGKHIFCRPDYVSERALVDALAAAVDTSEMTIPKHLLKYCGLSASSIERHLQEANLGSLFKSSMNKETADWFLAFPQAPHVNRAVEQVPSDLDPNELYGIDVCKMDSQSRLELAGEVPVLSMHDLPRPWTPDLQAAHAKSVPLGVYRVKSHVVVKHQGRSVIGWSEGVRNSSYVNWALQRNFISTLDIIEYVPATRVHPPDVLRALTCTYFKALDEKSAKSICNAGTGSYGVKYRKRVTACVETVAGSHALESENIRSLPIDHSDNHMLVRQINEEPILSNHWTLYNAIIETSTIRLYRMYKSMVGPDTILTGVKRDCLYGARFLDQRRPDLMFDESRSVVDNIGKIKLCDWALVDVQQTELSISFPVSTRTMNWTVVQTNSTEAIDLIVGPQGCQPALVTGGAGCGKSWLLREVYTQLSMMGSSVVVVCPTHTAKKVQMDQDVPAETIHSQAWANARKYKSIDDPDLAKEAFDVILVDEVGLTSWFHLGMACSNGAKVVLFGDFNQKTAVEVLDDNMISDGHARNPLSSALIVQACGGRRIDLMYREGSARYDTKLNVALDRLLQTGKMDFKVYRNDLEDAAEEFDNFACPTNAECDEINAFKMKLLAERPGAIQFDFEPHSDSKSQLKQWTLVPGESVICAVSNDSGKRWQNNFSFQFLGLTEDGEDVQLLEVGLELDEENVVTLSRDTFVHNFAPCWAKTVDRLQGASVDGRLLVVNRGGQYICRNSIYTACSRAKRWSDVFVTSLIEHEPFQYDNHVVLEPVHNGMTATLYRITLGADTYIGHTLVDLETRVDQHIKSQDEDLFHTKLRQWHAESKDISVECLDEIPVTSLKEALRYERQAIKTLAPTLNTVHAVRLAKKKQVEPRLLEMASSRIVPEYSHNRFSVCGKKFRWNKCGQDAAFDQALAHLGQMYQQDVATCADLAKAQTTQEELTHLVSNQLDRDVRRWLRELNPDKPVVVETLVQRLVREKMAHAKKISGSWVIDGQHLSQEAARLLCQESVLKQLRQLD